MDSLPSPHPLHSTKHPASSSTPTPSAWARSRSAAAPALSGVSASRRCEAGLALLPLHFLEDGLARRAFSHTDMTIDDPPLRPLLLGLQEAGLAEKPLEPAKGPHEEEKDAVL